MNYWIFVCNNHSEGGLKLTGREVWNDRKDARLWGIKKSTKNRNSISEGDQIVFYVGGKHEMVFVGSARASCSCYSSDSLTQADVRKHQMGGMAVADFYVSLDNIKEFPFEPSALSLFHDLEIFSGKQLSHWGSVFQGGIHRLSEADYRRIVDRANDSKSGESSFLDPDLDHACREGGAKLVTHMMKERSRAIRDRKIEEHLTKYKRLDCEVCGFNFLDTYGEKIGDYCEVHHRIPLSALEANSIVRTKDLAVLCANCHRAIHSTGNPIWTVERLKAQFEKRRSRK